MAINEDIIKTWYLTKNEENRATQSKADSIEFIFTKKLLEKYINKQLNVIEIGCGTGYYGMFLVDKCNTYKGIDITPEHIELFNEKIRKANIKNITAETGDATNLKNVENDEYDIVLVVDLFDNQEI